ncbi:MAG: flavodoxin family protein [Nitrospirae bacterium]|nr:flavodoxin family protein [Nitrospirota bacterium]
MKILAIHGSPRKEGNSEILLKEALKVIEAEGQEVIVIKAATMKIAPCLNCDGCVETGQCIIKDDMDSVFDAIKEADRVLVVSPVFFFGVPAQLKALIDRCQALWCKKYLLKQPISDKKDRKGLLILVGGMARERGFEASNATVTAFFRTIDVPKHEFIYFKSIDAKGEVLKHPEALRATREAAKRLIQVE